MWPTISLSLSCGRPVRSAAVVTVSPGSGCALPSAATACSTCSGLSPTLAARLSTVGLLESWPRIPSKRLIGALLAVRMVGLLLAEWRVNFPRPAAKALPPPGPLRRECGFSLPLGRAFDVRPADAAAVGEGTARLRPIRRRIYRDLR